MTRRGTALGLFFLAILPPAALAAYSARIARRAERLCPPGGRLVGIGGERVHVVEAGAGPPVLLVHGLAGQSGNFLFEVVGRLASSFRVVAIDRPGSGWSPRSRLMGANLRAQADIVAGVVAALDLGRPLVVGHSFGGAVALALALAHPDRVGGLALLAPLADPDTGMPSPFRLLAIRWRLLRFVAAWTVAVPAGVLRRRRTLAALFGPEAPPEDFGIRGGGLLALRPSTFIGAAADLAAAADDLPSMAERYRTLSMPVGALFGDADRVLDARLQGAVLRDAIPGLELEIIRGAGHMLPVTRGAETADFIRRQAERVAGIAASDAGRAGGSTHSVSRARPSQPDRFRSA